MCNVRRKRGSNADFKDGRKRCHVTRLGDPKIIRKYRFLGFASSSRLVLAPMWLIVASIGRIEAVSYSGKAKVIGWRCEIAVSCT